MNSVNSLTEAAGRARAWLFEAAPLWSAAQQGDTILFPESVSLHGERIRCPHRLRVQARHIFAFCTIGRLGWSGPWREMIERSADFLLRKARRADGFFIHLLDASGSVLDDRADLYDQAFVLLALAHAAGATSRSDFIGEAEGLDEALETRWRRTNGSYEEGEVVSCPPCRQNPHMHLLESFIALHAVTGAPRWRQRAEGLAKLCMDCFIDGPTGALTEYFDSNLRPVAGEQGRIVEPGHCFEWAWLFESLAQWGVGDAVVVSDRLTSFARRVGIEARRGVAINVVLTDGSRLDANARLWPQTERLKAALARYRRTGHAEECDEALAAYDGLALYLDTPRTGTWRDKLQADGSWVEEPAPGSSLYHIVCAMAELLECEKGR